MIPHERSLVQRLQGKPFVLLGVNTDDAAYYRKASAKEPTTWRNWRDDMAGPITTHWAVNGFPDVYLLDAHGVIRYHGWVNEKELDAKTEELLKEAEAETPAPVGGR